MAMSKSEAGTLGALRTIEVFKQRYLENPKQCKHCQTILPHSKRKNKFCDRSCAASFNNLKPKKKRKEKITEGVLVVGNYC
jgi:hypothetical protein